MIQPTLQPNGKTWTLARDFRATACGFGICVRRGFATDGASIPRAFWRVAGPPMDPVTCAPALVHDALYASASHRRATADEILYDLLRQYGAGRVKAWLYYRAVRAFGGMAWRAHTAESVLAARRYVRVLTGEAIVAPPSVDNQTGDQPK